MYPGSRLRVEEPRVHQAADELTADGLQERELRWREVPRLRPSYVEGADGLAAFHERQQDVRADPGLTDISPACFGDLMRLYVLAYPRRLGAEAQSGFHVGVHRQLLQPPQQLRREADAGDVLQVGSALVDQADLHLLRIEQAVH